jgi:hypothetical protein
LSRKVWHFYSHRSPHETIRSATENLYHAVSWLIILLLKRKIIITTHLHKYN